MLKRCLSFMAIVFVMVSMLCVNAYAADGEAVASVNNIETPVSVETVEVVESVENIEAVWDFENSCILVKNIPMNDGETYKVLIRKENLSFTYNWYAEKFNQLPVNSNGPYVVKVYQQIAVDGQTKYKVVFNTTITVENCKPFLGASEFVDFEDAQNLLVYGPVQEIINSETMSREEKVFAAYNFVKNCMVYDYELYSNQPSIYTSNADENLVDGKGICLDYASMLAVILRNAGIETKVLFGDTTFGYHAWNEVFINGQWVMMDACWGEYATTEYVRSVRYEF